MAALASCLSASMILANIGGDSIAMPIRAMAAMRAYVINPRWTTTELIRLVVYTLLPPRSQKAIVK